MFITRASRHDRDDVNALLEEQGWGRSDLSRGSVFMARDGAIVGCVRVTEVAPQTLVIDDMLVREGRRGEGIGSRLLQTAMNNRGGTIYLACHDDVIAFYERFGFDELHEADLPGAVVEHMTAEGDLPNRPDHIHRFMKAR